MVLAVLGAVAVLVALVLVLAARSRSAADAAAPGLESYTDRGDGCAQAVSAISYADDVLKPLGQEEYQDFDDAVRSRLAAVAGTLALEARDWPGPEVADQARVLQPLAERASAREDAGQRPRALLAYRVEAARLVLLCRDTAG